MKLFLKRMWQFLPAIFIILALLSLAYWLFYDPTGHLTISKPGLDAYKEFEEKEEIVEIGAFFEDFNREPPPLKEKWPRFRGALSDNIYDSAIPLKKSFGGVKPQILWETELGEGHAGAAIYDGLVYVLDYDEESRADMLRAFVLDTGEEVWRRWYNVHVRRNHGMSRTVPAVTENYILTIGPRGHVMCVERKTGRFLWGINIEKEFESEIPLWYTGQCPLIEDDVAIIATGGNALMIGLDCSTGDILWQTPNPNDWQMSHASVMPWRFAGRNMFVYSAIGGVVGIAADGPEAGQVLWETTLWNHNVVAPSAVCMPDGKVFLTAGYGAGSMLLQITENNGLFDVKKIMAYRPGEGLSSEQQTPIRVDDYLFGIMPKDARTYRNQFVCASANDPSNIIWSSGAEARFGLGPYILAGDKFYLLNDDATLYIIQKSTESYIELDKINLFDGFDAWAPLAIADGYMVLRDSEKMICIDLRR